MGRWWRIVVLIYQTDAWKSTRAFWTHKLDSPRSSDLSLGKPSGCPKTGFLRNYSLMAHLSLDLSYSDVAPRMTSARRESQHPKEFTHTKAQVSIVDSTKDFLKDWEEEFTAACQSPLLDIPVLSTFFSHAVSGLRHLSSFPAYLFKLQNFPFIIGKCIHYPGLGTGLDWGPEIKINFKTQAFLKAFFTLPLTTFKPKYNALHKGKSWYIIFLLWL